MLTHLDLFSGIGGFALAAEWAGFTTICFVEIDKYCQKVLRRHYLAVSIVEDIRNVKKIKEIVANSNTARQQDRLEEYRREQTQGGQRQYSSSGCGIGINPTGNRTATAIEPVTLVTAGFPCQPFSVAGKRGGEADNRYLWPETLTVIEAIKPEWVLLENVAGIINLALDTVLSDLEGAGYSYETLIIPACAVNAPHRRDRVWIVAHSKSNRFSSESPTRQRGNLRESPCLKAGSCSQDVADTSRNRLEGTIQTGNSIDSAGTINKRSEVARGNREGTIQWAIEPGLGRVAHGIPHRVDRLKCLGNAIVPQVAYQILKVIAELTGDSNG